MEVFKAGVQYGDWQGTVAADDAHDPYFTSFLKDKGLLDDGSYVVAIHFYADTSDVPSIRATIADGTGHDDVQSQINTAGVLRFKEIEVDLTLKEFFDLFKRFSIVLTSRDLGIDCKEYEIIDG